jgi:hypothetical protein
MAKISAHGDKKAGEWKDSTGCRIVLTEQGRVLRNYLKGDDLTIAPVFVMRGHKRKATLEEGEDYARRLGFTPSLSRLRPAGANRFLSVVDCSPGVVRRWMEVHHGKTRSTSRKEHLHD